MQPPPADEPWYLTAFRSDYREVYPHRDLESARREVAALLQSGLRGRVLDLCCGFGRHSLALAEAGVAVVGLDLSAELLADASGLEGGERLRGRLVRGDALALPFRARSFDGLVNLFSSFGYFGERGDARMLDEIARVVRPGARVVLDLMNPARIRAQLVPESRTRREGLELLERRSLLDAGRRVIKEVLLILPSGEQRRWREDVRMYEIEELAPLLADRGLRIESVAGDFDGAPYGAESARQLLYSRA